MVTAIESTLFPLLQGLAPGGVWPERLPQEIEYPAIVFTQIAGRPIQAQQTFKRYLLYQVDIWADNFDNMISVTKDVVTKLDHYNDGTTAILLSGEREEADLETGLFRKILEFDVWGS